MREKVLKLLEENERSQRWLAKKLDLNECTLWQKMTGRTEFRRAEVLAMCYIFNVEPDYFE